MRLNNFKALHPVHMQLFTHDMQILRICIYGQVDAFPYIIYVKGYLNMCKYIPGNTPDYSDQI